MLSEPNVNIQDISDSNRRERRTKPRISNLNESFNLRDDLRDLEDNLGLHRGGADSPLCGARRHYRLDPRALRKALLNHIEQYGDNNEYYIDDGDSDNDNIFSEIDGTCLNLRDESVIFANDSKPTFGNRLYNWTRGAVSKIRENICLGRSTKPEYEVGRLYRTHRRVPADTVQLVNRRIGSPFTLSLNGIVSIKLPSPDVRHGHSSYSVRSKSAVLGDDRSCFEAILG
ncbi:hypothetical protein V1505DRAFT_365209 [Lipomyces doorenjongii]